MKNLIMLMLFTSLIAISNCELEFVVEVFRHCARAAKTRESPYNFGAEWKDGPYECTEAGQRMHYLSGLKRRKQYIDILKFLPDVYDPQQLYAESTDTNRTIISGYSHLLGMYPLEKRKQYKIGFKNKYPELENQTITQNIPLHVGSAGKGLLDGIYDYGCYANDVFRKNNYNQSDYEFTHEDFVQDMVKELNQKIDFSNQSVFPKDHQLKTFTEIQPFVDSYNSINFENHEHSIHMSEDFISHMPEYFRLEHYYTVYRHEYETKLANHEFFSLLVLLISKHTDRKTHVKPSDATSTIPMDAKYYVLSAHDLTLTGILSGLNNKDQEFPGFASSLIFELHKESDSYFMRIIYNDKYINVNGICDDDYKCDMHEISSFLESQLLNTTRAEACELRFRDDVISASISDFLFYLTLGIIFMIVIGVIMMLRRRRTSYKFDAMSQEMQVFYPQIDLED